MECLPCFHHGLYPFIVQLVLLNQADTISDVLMNRIFRAAEAFHEKHPIAVSELFLL